MITSPQNKQIKEAQKLQRKRRRMQSGLILIEGQRLIQDALSTGVRPSTVFYTPEFEKKSPATAALMKKLEKISECLICTAQALNPLSNTVTPQGIVATVPQPELPLPNNPTLTLILDQVRDPGNVGTLLRSAEAAGVEQVLFAPNTVDPFNEKVIRAAMGAHFRLPIRIYGTWAALLTSIQYSTADINKLPKHIDSSPPIYLAEAHATLPYDLVNWSESAVLIVGGEAEGASADALSTATCISIPMYGGTESLNAGIAGSIVLFEAARQRRVALI